MKRAGTAGAIGAWRDEFLAAGREGLKARPAPVEDVVPREAQRKVGELSIQLDIIKALWRKRATPHLLRHSA